MFQHQWLVESVGKLVETVRGRRLLIKVSLSHAGLLFHISHTLLNSHNQSRETLAGFYIHRVPFKYHDSVSLIEP